MKLFSLLRNALTRTYLYVFAIPLLFIFLGAASNQAVIIANNDTFPVRANLVKVKADVGDNPTILSDGTLMLDDVHCLMTSKTRLNWLADNFDFQNSIMSIGDLSLDLGEWSFGYSTLVWGVLVVKKLKDNE